MYSNFLRPRFILPVVLFALGTAFPCTIFGSAYPGRSSEQDKYAESGVQSSLCVKEQEDVMPGDAWTVYGEAQKMPAKIRRPN